MFLIKIFWFLLPAAIANMSPVLFKCLPFFNYPIDNGMTFRGKRLFGKNKTFRGVIFATLMAILVVYLQIIFYDQAVQITLFNYSKINPILLGFLFGFGALFGDLIESFFKRQLEIQSGKSWPPFDQIDWVIGSLIFAAFYISISWEIALTSMVLFGILHPIVNLMGYYLGIKNNKF